MILHQLLFALVVFLGILWWIVVIDVILSWSVLFGVQVKVPFIRGVLDPIYLRIRKKLPTTFHGIDLTPLVLVLFIDFCRRIVLSIDPSIAMFL